MCVIERVMDALDRMQADGRRPVRLLIGHREAGELERALYQPAKIWRGMFGEVIAEDEEFAPKLPYPMTEAATLFDVPIERVDQETLIGVIGEDR